MTYQDRISMARGILESFNETQTDPANAKPVDIDRFFLKLTQLGAVNEELLSQVSWEDLQECGAPRLLARQIAANFRNAEPPASTPPQQVVVVDNDPDKLARAMTRRQLVEAYEWSDAKNAVGERLHKLSDGRRFLVYHANGVKNIDKSVSLLDGLDEFGELREVRATNAGGEEEVCEVLSVGEKPFQVVDEHPMFKDEPLRPDGTSRSGLDWSAVDFETRQLVAIISRTDGWGSKTEADVIEEAETKGRKGLAKKFLKAAMKLQRLQAEGRAPTLKISVRRNQSRPNNPFGVGQSRTT